MQKLPIAEEFSLVDLKECKMSKIQALTLYYADRPSSVPDPCIIFNWQSSSAPARSLIVF